MVNKEFDIILFGATSFAGKIMCEYLVGEHIEPNLSWAMAARSEFNQPRANKAVITAATSAVPIIIKVRKFIMFDLYNPARRNATIRPPAAMATPKGIFVPIMVLKG